MKSKGLFHFTLQGGFIMCTSWHVNKQSVGEGQPHKKQHNDI